MPEVTVTVPGLLARFTDGRRTLALRADTVRGAVDELVATYPALGPHLYDGAGRPRPHLRLFHDGTGVEWDATDGLEAGDRVVVVQAVSGG